MGKKPGEGYVESNKASVTMANLKRVPEEVKRQKTAQNVKIVPKELMEKIGNLVSARNVSVVKKPGEGYVESNKASVTMVNLKRVPEEVIRPKKRQRVTRPIQHGSPM